MKILNFFRMICLFSLTGITAQNSVVNDKRIDEFIAEQMESTGTLGMAVAIIKDGKILHQNSYGIANVEYAIPVSSNTNFTIASVTKLITSTLVMKLVQEKKISLEEPVGKYIPKAVNWKNIKIKHLMAHEGGIEWPASLGGYLGIGSATNFKVESIDDLIARLSALPLLYDPGTKQAYQNGDYFVLQYIIEKLYGASFDNILEKELLQYLGMNDGGYDREIRSSPYQTMKPVKNKAQNYTKGTKGLTIFKGFYAPSSYAAGGLFLSLDDLIKWAIMLDEGSIISRSIQEKAYHQTSAPNGEFSQMGWVLKKDIAENGLNLAGHSGGPGLGDVLRLPAHKFTVIVLTNNVDLNAYMAEKIIRMYYPIATEIIPPTFERNLSYY